MSQAIKNVLNAFAFDKVEAIRKTGDIITPEILDAWEKELHGHMKENDQIIGKARIRELVVAYICDEFTIEAFGVKPNVKGTTEISEKMVRKMKSQRKKGFKDLKIVKG